MGWTKDWISSYTSSEGEGEGGGEGEGEGERGEREGGKARKKEERRICWQHDYSMEQKVSQTSRIVLQYTLILFM